MSQVKKHMNKYVSIPNLYDVWLMNVIFCQFVVYIGGNCVERRKSISCSFLPLVDFTMEVVGGRWWKGIRKVSILKQANMFFSVDSEVKISIITIPFVISVLIY